MRALSSPYSHVAVHLASTLQLGFVGGPSSLVVQPTETSPAKTADIPTSFIVVMAKTSCCLGQKRPCYERQLYIYPARHRCHLVHRVRPTHEYGCAQGTAMDTELGRLTGKPQLDTSSCRSQRRGSPAW